MPARTASVAWGERAETGEEDGAGFGVKCLGDGFEEDGAQHMVCKDSSSFTIHFKGPENGSFADSEHPGLMWDGGGEHWALLCRREACQDAAEGDAQPLACEAGLRRAPRAPARAPSVQVAQVSRSPAPGRGGAPLGGAAGAGAEGAPRAEEDTLELTVVSMAGSRLAALPCLPGDLVSEVKRRLSRITGTAASEQRLVHDHAILKDQDTLMQCGIAKPGATLQCICIRPSAIARNLESERLSGDPALAIGACLADVADSVMQSEYAQSESARPCAADVTRPITLRHRGELINWMVQAFDVLQFDDSMLHSIVLTLDRYYARRVAPIEVTGIQRVLLSAVCTEMKLASEVEFPRGHWQRVLTHLCHGRLSIASILQTEFEVLSRLGFVVGVPTPVTFVRELAVHLREVVPAEDCERAVQLALLLLELALYEPELQYGRPHAVLAAAALGAAARTLGAPGELHEALLEDLAVYCPGLHRAEEALLEGEEELLELWLACAGGAGEWSGYYAQLEAKFGRRARHCVALSLPKAGLERLRACRGPAGPRGAGASKRAAA